MSLQIGKWFYRALTSDFTVSQSVTANVSTEVSGRIYPVGRTSEQEAEDNIPYIVISPESTTSRILSEDQSSDTFYDDCTVRIIVCATTYDTLVHLTTLVRLSVAAYYDDPDTSTGSNTTDPLPFVIEEYDFSADAPQLDPSRPCFWQTLTFRCVTNKS